MDKERLLVKLDEMEGYLNEIKEITPDSFEEYERDKLRKRAAERLLHVTIESAIDVCFILIKELRLGVPSSEDDYFDKLANVVITKEMVEKLKETRKILPCKIFVPN